MPYWRLSTFYLFYFASLGALIPYWGVYMKQQGYSSVQIGELVALILFTKIISPNIWGWIADHTGRSMGVVRLGSLLAALFFVGVFWVENYLPLVVVMVAFSFFWNAVLPQFEANTLHHLGDDTHRYSTIRLWGSVGFVIAVAGLGILFDHYSAALLPVVLLSLFVAIWLSTLLVPEQSTAHDEAPRQSLRAILRKREVLSIVVVCFLMQASHGSYYTFYTIYLEGHGYSRTLSGQLWALGVIAEVAIFLLMHRLVPLFGLKRLLIAALLVTAVRWGLIGGAPENLSLLVAAQTLHAASFGIFHVVAIALFYRHFSGRNRGRGQALYSSISFGAGGAFGSLLSGYLWDQHGGEMTYFISMVMVIIALVIAWREVKD